MFIKKYCINCQVGMHRAGRKMSSRALCFVPNGFHSFTPQMTTVNKQSTTRDACQKYEFLGSKKKKEGGDGEQM